MLYAWSGSQLAATIREPSGFERLLREQTESDRWEGNTGSWGHEIFDSDTALDAPGNVIHDISARLDRDLDEAFEDGILERSGLALASILNALLTQLPDARLMVEADQVDTWQGKFARWMEQERQVLIEAGFDLNKLSADAETVFSSLRTLVRSTGQ